MSKSITSSFSTVTAEQSLRAARGYSALSYLMLAVVVLLLGISLIRLWPPRALDHSARLN